MDGTAELAGDDTARKKKSFDEGDKKIFVAHLETCACFIAWPGWRAVRPAAWKGTRVTLGRPEFESGVSHHVVLRRGTLNIMHGLKVGI